MTDQVMKIEARFDAALLDELRRENVRLRQALSNILEDAQIANQRRTPEDWDFACFYAVEEATTALAAERGQS